MCRQETIDSLVGFRWRCVCGTSRTWARDTRYSRSFMCVLAWSCDDFIECHFDILCGLMTHTHEEEEEEEEKETLDPRAFLILYFIFLTVVDFTLFLSTATVRHDSLKKKLAWSRFPFFFFYVTLRYLAIIATAAVVLFMWECQGKVRRPVARCHWLGSLNPICVLLAGGICLLVVLCLCDCVGLRHFASVFAS